jgi:GNAT superfamily N-acetyltransferase
MLLTAETAGGEAHRERGVAWAASPAGAVLAFPRLSSRRLAALLPDLLAAGRRAGAREASSWSQLPTEPTDLDTQLHAAGFRDGWQAHWMAIELDHVSATPPPAGTELGLSAGTWEPTRLPYDGAGIARVRARLGDARPRRVWHLAARRDGEAVGHALVHVTRGPLGVAGLYDMGVLPSERRHGIGRALVARALELARSQRCAVATLNATPEGELLYRHVGFRSVGVAQTWWLDL